MGPDRLGLLLQLGLKRDLPAIAAEAEQEMAMNDTSTPERHDVIVIGGGQAGLATSHHLARRGIAHLVLEAGAKPGDAWRRRWDSLRLFTPAAIDALPGMPFPADRSAMPTKDEMADYLAAYAERERAPVRFGTRVDRLERDGDAFAITAGTRRFVAREVIVATGFVSAPFIPSFAHELAPSIVQLHSDAYRAPTSIQGTRVLLVGGGNSGAEIALELASAGRQVQLAGHSTFLPAIARIAGGRPFFAFARRILTVDTPIGRRLQERMGSHGSAPVIRVRPVELSRARVERVARVTSVRDGSPVLADGRTLDVDAVLWCTGFRPAFDWIAIPVIGENGLPRHVRGVVPEVPGLSFVGLPFQTSFLSALVGGVGRDADTITGPIASRLHRGTGPRAPIRARDIA